MFTPNSNSLDSETYNSDPDLLNKTLQSTQQEILPMQFLDK